MDISCSLTFSSEVRPAFDSDWDRLPVSSIPTEDLTLYTPNTPTAPRKALLLRLGISEYTRVSEAVALLGERFYNTLTQSALNYTY
jgi:hypothetical protein